MSENTQNIGKEITLEEFDDIISHCEPCRFATVIDEFTRECDNCSILIGMIKDLRAEVLRVKSAFYTQRNNCMRYKKSREDLIKEYDLIYYMLEPNMRPRKFDMGRHWRF